MALDSHNSTMWSKQSTSAMFRIAY